MANQQVSFSQSLDPRGSTCRSKVVGEYPHFALSLSAGVGVDSPVSYGASLASPLTLGLQERKRRHRLGSSCALTTKISEGLPTGRQASLLLLCNFNFLSPSEFRPVGQFCDSRANHLDVVGFFCLVWFFFC